jgi:hypothetical protein
MNTVAVLTAETGFQVFEKLACDNETALQNTEVR